MASSRIVSEEELQKARDDFKKFGARYAIDVEFGSSCSDDEDNKGQENTAAKNKKTKLRVMPQEKVDFLLNYECRPLHEPRYTNKLAKDNEELYGCFKTLATAAGVFARHHYGIIRAAQAELRREIEAKGEYTYEVTDDEDEKAAGLMEKLSM